jgi:hypothetical protein
MNTTYVKVALATLAMSLVFASCGTSKKTTAVSVTDQKEMPKQVGVPAEVEISFPCEGIDSNEDFFRVNGNGNSKDRTMAKERAYQNALANLASKLAGLMSMGNNQVAVSTNADGEEFHDKMVAVSKQIAQANIAGYRTACEKFTMNTTNGSYNCYVTIEYGNKKIVKQLYDALDSQKLLKADYDFDRYLKGFNEDLKEYEEANK